MRPQGRIILRGFLPWRDPDRQVVVTLNPAAVVAERVARALSATGADAEAIAMAVSADGIRDAMSRVTASSPSVVVGLGHTPTEPRVERAGRVPGAWARAADGEETPWLLGNDAGAIVRELNQYSDPAARLEPFRESDDPGGYYCDHLCVELSRDARRRGSLARFLHLTGVDRCSPAVREARLRQYERQVRAVLEWLAHAASREHGPPVPHAPWSS
jgi:hypothetical protein